MCLWGFRVKSEELSRNWPHPPFCSVQLEISRVSTSMWNIPEFRLQSGVAALSLTQRNMLAILDIPGRFDRNHEWTTRSSTQGTVGKREEGGVEARIERGKESLRAHANKHCKPVFSFLCWLPGVILPVTCMSPEMGQTEHVRGALPTHEHMK